MGNSIVHIKDARPEPRNRTLNECSRRLRGEIQIIVDISVNNISLDTGRNMS